MSDDIGQFGGYLTASFPSQLNVDVTEFCNLACIHCPYEVTMRPKGKNRAQLDEALHRKLVEETAREGRGQCRFVRYTGEGEPLLHPRLAAMMADMRQRTGVQVALTTNGLLLDEMQIRDILDAEINVVDISLDAQEPNTYAKIRVKGDLRVAHENVHRLIAQVKARGGKTKVMVSFVQQPLNQAEAQPFKEYWEKAGADFVVLRTMHSCAGHISEIKQAMWAQAPTPRKPCLYPWERLALKPDGSVCYCPADWYHSSAVGHFATQSVAEIWQGEAMQKVRQAHVSGDFSQHGFCGQCPDWMVIKWPSEGRSYASVMHEFEADRHGGADGAS